MKRALLWSLVFSPFLLVSTATAQPGAGAGAGRAERPERIGPTLRQTPLGRIVSGDDANANDTQRRLQELLQQYPPSLGRVLALDPTLLSNDTYLQPYPQLATFLAQHPEIAHNPSYFFDQQYRDVSRRQYDYNDPKIAAIRAIDQTLGGLAAMLVGLTVIGTAAWLIRSAIEYRKWLRVSKTHVDTHAQVDGPVDIERRPRGLHAIACGPAVPRSRADSARGGTASALRAIGPHSLVRAGRHRRRLPGRGPDVFEPASWLERVASPRANSRLFVIGACALAIGAGFFVSAFVSWGLSHRLGLFRSNGSSDSATGTASCFVGVSW